MDSMGNHCNAISQVPGKATGYSHLHGIVILDLSVWVDLGWFGLPGLVDLYALHSLLELQYS